MILAGDIGGTSARLALCEPNGTTFQIVTEQTRPSREYDSLEAIVREFTGFACGKLSAASLGIAGPVSNGVVHTPNLPWVVESERLARTLGLGGVALLNDLEANAYGIAALAPDEFVTLNAGVPDPHGNAAIISAGTGLGEAGMFWDGTGQRPFACEGGHADFAPNSRQEIELLEYLQPKFGHVSWERVLSGPGLHNIHKFLRDCAHKGGQPSVGNEGCNEQTPGAISQAAIERRCPRCAQALELFVWIYGAAAGNLALKFMARGGVYLGGGIAPKIIGKLRESTFMEAFVAKGRMRPLLETIPVRVVMNDKAALLGAANHALSNLRRQR